MKIETKRKSEIIVEDITIDVEWKNIKNIHLRVYPPDGNVRISAPLRVDACKLRTFAEAKLDWIRKQQIRVKGSRTSTPCKYVSGEPHFYCGRSYILEIEELDTKPHAVIKGDAIKLYVRPGASAEKRKAVLESFYRKHLRQVLPSMIERWEKVLNVKVNEFGIKRMKTKWGTCNQKAKRIWINLELSKKLPECLEYVVVHEMVHILERYHNTTFYGYMDRFLPQWRLYRNKLNS